MGGKIFLVRDNDELVEMNEQKYESEARLQDLLTKYPDLLAGDQMLSTSPRRFVLTKPEAGVPSEEEGSDVWSLDHLFVDQDGIPTLVEVKRSTDTRIRREVVGQMLDYAANSVVYWPIEEIRARFYAHWDDPSGELDRLLGSDYDEDEFWGKVATNLKAGKVRLVFLADAIPAELRRIVEFLGEQMTPAEVFAVEVKQFLSKDGLQTLVPQVVAQTSPPKRTDGPGRNWNDDSFFDELKSRGSEFVTPARTVIAWANERGLEISWGKGRQNGSFTPKFSYDGSVHRVFSVWTSGHVQMHFGDLKFHPPFDSQDARLQLLAKVNEATGVQLPDDGAGRYPSYLLSDVSDMAGLLAVFDWALEAIRSVPPREP
ncbi:MAG: hypothetical protein IIC91_12775 [Chloroflexi bacterium]|nr:hypothetical protein [Chloroflexota bacterium]